MSQNHKPAPRQDRRRIGRAPVRDHAGKSSVGTVSPKTVLDRENGRGAGVSGGMRAPGANGPAVE